MNGGVENGQKLDLLTDETLYVHHQDSFVREALHFVVAIKGQHK